MIQPKATFTNDHKIEKRCKMDEVRDSYKEIMLACYYAVYKPSKIVKDYCSYA